MSSLASEVVLCWMHCWSVQCVTLPTKKSLSHYSLMKSFYSYIYRGSFCKAAAILDQKSSTKVAQPSIWSSCFIYLYIFLQFYTDITAYIRKTKYTHPKYKETVVPGQLSCVFGQWKITLMWHEKKQHLNLTLLVHTSGFILIIFTLATNDALKYITIWMIIKKNPWSYFLL